MIQLKSIHSKIHPPVFYTSVAFIVLIVLIASLWPTWAQTQLNALQTYLFTNVSWFYISAVAFILIAIVLIGFSRFGEIKLGPDHAEPEYSYFSWFAMLFSAGMGIGLMFFGVAEPSMHYLMPPVGEPGSIAAAKEAFKITFFHWGLHAWAVYAIVGLTLAFFSFRHGLPLTLRSAFYPLLGDKIYGPIGDAVDVFAVVCTVFGIAASLGYGVLQVNAGLNHLFGLPINSTVQVFLLIAITILATISVVSGVNKGIRRLSELNLSLAFILLTLVIILGPTVLLLKTFVQNTGAYFGDIVSKTFNLYAYEPSQDKWMGGWTLLYWGWWLSWSPFVGMFIARVSRGRTIREFVTGVLFVPTAFTLLWMNTFGVTTIDLIAHQGATHLAQTIQTNVPVALFEFLEYFPFSPLLNGFAILMVVVFFITSADSGALVVDTLSSNGAINTPIWQRIFWGSSIGILGAVLLRSGGLAALQTMAIASAFPFAIVLLFAIYGLFRALQSDHYKQFTKSNTTLAPNSSRNPMTWQKRLQNIIHYPEKDRVVKFFAQTIHPAFDSVKEALVKENRLATLTEKKGAIRLEVDYGESTNFVYEVKLKGLAQPSFALVGFDDDDDNDDTGDSAPQKYYRAEVYLMEGGQGYDLMGWTQEQIIQDILDQFEKHIAFLQWNDKRSD